ncbi:GMC family oxidoreductase N-terminal domain-containing protein, partial [Rhizobiaceae sp. 2RAB30]
TVCRARSTNVLHNVFAQAGGEAGHPLNDDFNGEDQEGFGKFDFTIKKGKRWSTSYAFLRPVLGRPNLTVETRALTRRILMEKGRAVGVEFQQGSAVRTVRAAREIVLCAGTVNSPQLLMLSGIGPADELAGHGISPVMDLPGVGKNLQDHVDCVMVYECTKPVTLYSDLRADRLIWSVIEGTLFGRGVATTFPYEAGAFLKSRTDLVAPDIQVHFMPALEKTANLHFPNPFRKKVAVEANHGFTLRVGPVNPESRGEITLRSADPSQAPKIQANYL